MKRYPKIWILRYLLVPLLLGGLVHAAGAAVNSPLDLATIPLANSPTVTIQPNLLYALDDSGSMGWDYMPDSSNSSDIMWKRNFSYNTMAYNPATLYLTPVTFDAGGENVTAFPSQIGMTSETGASTAAKPNWRKVASNAFSTGKSGNTSSNTNLEVDSFYVHIIAGEYCTATDLKSCVLGTAPTPTHPYPAPLRWCSTAAASTTAAAPADGLCQATRIAPFTNRRSPILSTTSLTVANNDDDGAVTSVKVNGKEILSGPTAVTNNSNTEASRIAASINDCTLAIVGNCTTFGYYATSSNRTVTLYLSGEEALAGYTAAPVVAVDPDANKSVTGATFKANNVPGKSVFVVITPEQASYTLPGSISKALGRTDCASSTCTYEEEMTNYANWWTYYHTRMQTMKTATSLAFKGLGENFRVGLITINSTKDKSLKFDTFNTTHKALWYDKLFSIPASGNTPLRLALSRAGRIYAKKETVSNVFSDPIEYECQQNYTLLTTDGFWNSSAGVKLDGSAMTNQDGSGTPRPKYEGPTANSDSLADVARYYRETDLRTAALGNCTGALGQNVCESPPPSEANKKQTMVTLTLGLGLDGTLAYSTDYKTATSGDFYDIKTGSKDWPKPVADTPTAIDDLWHAAVNGDGTYFSAKNPDELTWSLGKALKSIEVKLGAGAAAATSTLNPVPAEGEDGEPSFAYIASYTTGQWTGNLEKRVINENTGAIGTETPTNCGGPCDAESKLRKRAWEENEWDQRKIYTSNGSGKVKFEYGNLSPSQRAYFDPDFLKTRLSQWVLFTPEQQAQVSGEALVNYLRGQTELDENADNPNHQVFRARQAVLGDVINARPAFVGKPTFSYVDSGYSDFKSGKESRSKTVYVAANDGMLHAFDAKTMEERWAYIPSMVLPNMWKLADITYDAKHSFYADGTPIVSDVYVSGQWRTILVAGLNAGGRGYYALDVTDPGEEPTLLWEFDANDEPNLGYTFGEPVITKDPTTGKWVVLVTSGYNNIPDNHSFYNQPTTKFKPNNPAQFTTGNGKGYLYVLDAVTGAKLKQLETNEGSTLTPSGLAKITAYAENAELNNTATYVYGGDLLGNLWRFDLNDNSVSKLAKLKDSSGAVQPITTRPEIGLIKKHRAIFIGTGKYLEVTDLTNVDKQTLYAIKDTNTATIDNPRNNGLVQQTMEVVGSNKRESTSNNAVNWDMGLGWYIDFPSVGERQHVASNLTLGTLLVPTTVPTSSACQPSGYGWLSYFDYRTGLSVLNNNMVSQMFSAPIVGFNVLYIEGKPKVNVVKADDPNPELLEGVPLPSAPAFNKIRSIWRELVP